MQIQRKPFESELKNPSPPEYTSPSGPDARPHPVALRTRIVKMSPRAMNGGAENEIRLNVPDGAAGSEPAMTLADPRTTSDGPGPGISGPSRISTVTGAPSPQRTGRRTSARNPATPAVTPWAS